MNGTNIGIGEIMLWFHELEIIHKLLQSCTPIIVTIVGSSKESFKIRQCDFCGVGLERDDQKGYK